MKSYHVLFCCFFFPYIFLLLNKTIRTGKRIQHQVYIEKACPVYNRDSLKNIAHKKRKETVEKKEEGHAEQQIESCAGWRVVRTDKADHQTERIGTGRRHALRFTRRRYEHAGLSETNRKEPNRTSHLISKPCSLFHRSDGVLAYLQSHLNKTKQRIHSFVFWFIYIYMYIYYIYIIHHSKDRIKTLKTPPVHLLHTIGSQKYFGHFAFQQTAAFHYKNVVLNTDTEHNRWKAWRTNGE